ncbi:helix-turn-helix domain-containing protein [Frigoribacterium salinisoli]
MSEKASDGIGERLKAARKAAGLSARELSEKLGGQLSRGVIANIESGARRDLTVDELIALSWALDVPPAALALPYDEPYKTVSVIAGPGASEDVIAGELLAWFTNPDRPAAKVTGAGALMRERVRRAMQLLQAVSALAQAEARPDGWFFGQHVHDLELDRDQAVYEAERVGIKLAKPDLE